MDGVHADRAQRPMGRLLPSVDPPKRGPLQSRHGRVAFSSFSLGNFRVRPTAARFSPLGRLRPPGRPRRQADARLRGLLPTLPLGIAFSEVWEAPRLYLPTGSAKECSRGSRAGALSRIASLARAAG